MMTLRENYWWIRGLINKDKCCTGKIKFNRKSSAYTAKLAMEKKRAPKKFDAYWCPWCHKYHIGKSVKTIDKNKKLWWL